MVWWGAVGDQLREVVAGENIERLKQGDAAGAGRGRGDHVEAAVVADQRLAVLYLVSGKVLRGDQAAVGLFKSVDLLRHDAVIKVVRIPCDVLQRAGQLGLL